MCLCNGFERYVLQCGVDVLVWQFDVEVTVLHGCVSVTV